MLLFSLLSHFGGGAVISQGTHLRCWGFRTWPCTYTTSHFRTALGRESDGGRKGEESRGQRSGVDKALKLPNLMGSMSPDTTKGSQEETTPQCKTQSGYTRQPYAGDG